jgi:hypothetical protein
MKKGDKVIAPKGCASYLTAGKEYEVLRVDDKSSKYGYSFNVLTDCGAIIFTCEKKSSHLIGQDWIIPTKEENHENRYWKNKQLDLDTDYHKGARTGFIIGGAVGCLIGIVIGVLIVLICI